MTTLMIINGAAYGQHSTYNALRLAVALSKRDGATVQVFLMGDGVTVAMDGQETPDGYYKLDQMLSAVAAHGDRIGCCRTCMDARGITDALLTGTAKRSTMEDLADVLTVSCETPRASRHDQTPSRGQAQQKK